MIHSLAQKKYWIVGAVGGIGLLVAMDLVRQSYSLSHQTSLLTSQGDSLSRRMHKKQKDYRYFQENFPAFQRLNIYNRQPYHTQLTVGEGIQSCAEKHGLYEIKFSFTAEKRGALLNNLPTIMTPISISFKADSDLNIFAFVRSLHAKFPGFLMPRHLVLRKSPNGKAFGISGRYDFDWVVVDDTP